MNRCFLPVLCVVLIFHPGPTLTQDLRPGIIGEDNRVIVVDEGRPWDAIGQVNIGDVGRMHGHSCCAKPGDHCCSLRDGSLEENSFPAPEYPFSSWRAGCEE